MRYETYYDRARRIEHRSRILETITGAILVVAIIAIVIILAGVMQ